MCSEKKPHQAFGALSAIGVVHNNADLETVKYRLLRMPKQDLVGQLNRISSLFRLGLPSEEERAVCDIFGLTSEFPLSLIGDDREHFRSSLDELLGSFSEAKGTISRELVINELIPRIRQKKISGSAFTLAEADLFKNTICDLPVQVFRVLRRILGIEMAVDAGPIRFGDFLIDFGRRFFASAQESPLLASTLTPEDLNQLFIECRVEARDTTVALELADALFYRFELIFRVFIGRRTRWVEVGVANYSGPQMRGRFILSEDGHPVSHSSSWEGAMQPFILGDTRFPMPTPPFIRLFGLISRPNNEFEKHVIRCAEWTGQAIAEPNAAAALVKAAIALEVLFSANEKGAITPSIMAQISESCAFLLGNDTTAPMEIEREVKRLYGVRSSVVHSGKDSVNEKDLNAFISICRRVMLMLLTDQEFSGMSNMGQLADYFRGRKYAFMIRSNSNLAKKDPATYQEASPPGAESGNSSE